MGHDEHGPTDPGPHPVWDDTEWMRMRTDYDRSPMRTLYQEILEPTEPPLWQRLIMLAVVTAALLWLFSVPAHAMNHGFDPNSPVTKWMERQIRPDSPPNSCCGVADSYPVDTYEIVKESGWDEEAHSEKHKGDYKVWIQNGDAIEYPDGSRRAPWDIRVPVIVPSNKVNPEDDDLDNPTDHSVLFFRPTNETMPGTFYCFIRHPQGN